MINKKILLSLALAALLVAQPAFAFPRAVRSDEEARLREIVDQYFAAFAREQIEEMMALWDSGSSFLAARRSEIEKAMANQDRIEIKSARASRIRIEGDRASLRACVETKAIEAKSGKAVAAKIIRSLHLVKSEQRWKICRDESTEEEIASALIAATDRESLLIEEKEFLTEELTRVIYRQATQLRNQARYDEAFERYRLSQKVSECIDFKAGVASALTGMGNVYVLRIDNARALGFYLDALKISEKLDDANLLASILNNVGGAYKDLGETALAEQYLRRALELSRASKNNRLIALILLLLTDVLTTQCNYSAAMACAQEGLTTSESARYEYGVTVAMASMAAIHIIQGNYQQALGLYERAFRMSEMTGQKSSISTALSVLARAHALSGNYQQALDYSKKSLAMAEETKNRALIWIASRINGQVNYLMGNHDEALRKIQEALAISEESGNKPEIVSALIQTGSIHYAQGDYAKTLEAARRAATLAREIGSLQNYSSARAMEGKALRATAQFDKAAESFADAIEGIESLRFKVAGGEQDRQRFFENKISPYHEMVSLLVSQGRDAQALLYAERAKARVLLDVLQNGRINISKAMSDDERREEQRLRIEQASLNVELQHQRQSAGSRITELESSLQKARLAYDEFQSRLYAAHPELKAKRGEVRPIKPEEAGALIAPTGALIEYVVMDETTFLFSMTRTVTGVDLKVHPIAVSRKEIRSLVESFRRKLAQRDLRFREPARKLYEILVKPAQGHLRGKTSCVIVPDDALWELPFQALITDSNRYLIEERALAYAPSLTALREMTAQRKKRGAISLLAFANPLPNRATIPVGQAQRGDALASLPETELEVKALARLYGALQSRIYTGADAREDRVKTEASDYTILHFATHGILEDSSPMNSCLVLSRAESLEDGLLEARELMEMDLKADLVVLSACETARGRFGAGEGMIGLSWALFVAGVPTTVVSQWKVDQASTSQLMFEFHKNLRASQTKTGAMRAAAIRLLRERKYRHPFYWAGFVVIGDGR